MAYTIMVYPLRFFRQLSRLNFFLLLGAGFVAGLMAVKIFVGYAERDLALDMAKIAEDRLTLYSGTLHSALNKYSYLPHILATHPDIQDLALRGENTNAVNEYLENINATSGSMELFILDTNGKCIASSNWNTPETFVGHDYRYRPYYQNALRIGSGGYFGVGATTGRPGFFFTERICVDGVALGVAVTKVDLAMLQREWRDGGETVFITDRHGVIFLSSRDDWRYKATKSLSNGAKEAMIYQRQYGNSLPDPIDLHAFSKNDVSLMQFGGQTWLYTTQAIAPHGWTIWFCSPVTALRERIETIWFLGCGALCMVLLFLLLVRAVIAWSRAKREVQEAEKIRAVNRRLAEEIRIRKKTEKELLEAQDDLLHASRMAALGQVAASMVHELSQPVTSMSMFASSCRRMVQEGHYAKVGETIGHMLSLVQRIRSLIEQLKHFSRKAPVNVAPVSLGDAIGNALTVLQFKQEIAKCTPRVVCPTDILVLADALQLEQVLINLVQNAFDAVQALEDETERAITITAERDAAIIRIVIADNGFGILPEIREKIFTPFFTTKKSGEGIGLGLAIVDNIIHSMGGSITAGENGTHGTCFTLTLPAAVARGNNI